MTNVEFRYLMLFHQEAVKARRLLHVPAPCWARPPVPRTWWQRNRASIQFGLLVGMWTFILTSKPLILMLVRRWMESRP